MTLLTSRISSVKQLPLKWIVMLTDRVLGHSLGCGLHFLSQSKTHMIKQWVWWHKVSWHVFAGLGLGVRKCGWSLAEIAYNSLTSKLLGAKHSPLHFFFAHCQWVIHEGHSPIDFWEVGGNMPEKQYISIPTLFWLCYAVFWNAGYFCIPVS